METRKQHQNEQLPEITKSPISDRISPSEMDSIDELTNDYYDFDHYEEKYRRDQAPAEKEDVIIDQSIPHSENAINHSLTNKNHQIMNTQNLEFLQKTLKNLGFGDEVNFALEDAMKAKEKSLTFFIEKDINGRYISYDLHFKAGDKQDMYFFNSYDAQLEKGVNEKDVKQTFYINKGSGITAKEAFNLMDGRAVHKQLFNLEGQKYHAWLTLDPNNLTENGNMKIKHYHENYGFDLEKTITDKGIKELEDPKSKQDLLYSLNKGNIQQITVAGKEGDQKYYIAANPQFKTVDLYDSQMKKIKREVLLQPEQNAVKSIKQKEQQKEELPAKKQSRKKGMTV